MDDKTVRDLMHSLDEYATISANKVQLASDGIARDLVELENSRKELQCRLVTEQI